MMSIDLKVFNLGGKMRQPGYSTMAKDGIILEGATDLFKMDDEYREKYLTAKRRRAIKESFTKFYNEITISD